jgi:hypothetical protein
VLKLRLSENENEEHFAWVFVDNVSTGRFSKFWSSGPLGPEYTDYPGY